MADSLQLKYEHVDSHQDKKRFWWQLSLEEQLNCVCDGLAKAAVYRSMAGRAARKGVQLLPREKAAIVVNGTKLTTDSGEEVRYCLGEREAKSFYTAAKKKRGGGLGWSEERYNQVAWIELEQCLKKKPDMYGIWLTKQSADAAATRYNMARLQNLIDNKCPNCGQVERAIHLNMCPSENRTRLLTEGVEELHEWLTQDGKTNEELSYWIPKYILLRGQRTWESLGGMSSAMHRVAASQDKIGWREFMEGKISKEIVSIQRLHCARSPGTMNGDDWTRHFLGRILQLSHSQWIFRNITLHDRSRGILKLQRRREILLEVDRLMEVDTTELPQESQFLLEMDFNSLIRSPIDKQS